MIKNVFNKMTRKSVFVFLGIYIFMYCLNYLTPMAFGDDYLYSFIWQGNTLFTPLTEDAVRVFSWRDLFVSQWSHYLTWSGRTVNHTITQFFLWQGKQTFNFFNAFIVVLLIAELYWCIDNGKVGFEFKPKTIWWIFISLWIFTPGFAPTFLWLDGACNYLWTNVILLGFLIPYIHKYYFPSVESGKHKRYNILFFAWGILSGWTNENSVCWIILFIFLCIFIIKKKNQTEDWMYWGLLGLMIGYSLLMLAPGNMERLKAVGSSELFSMKRQIENLKMLFMVILFQLILWYFSIRALCILNKKNLEKPEIKDKVFLTKVCCLLAFFMSAIMVIVPFFPPRSAFAGTIYLIFAVGNLLDLQAKYNIILIRKNAIKFLSVVASLYFCMTSVVTLYISYDTYKQMEDLIFFVEQEHSRNDGQTVLSVKSFSKTSRTVELMSGFHILNIKLSDNENNWMNVAFSRYFGIKGIRMTEENPKDAEISNVKNVKTESDSAGFQSR